MLAERDPLLAESSPPAGGEGTVELIALAEEAEGPMTVVSSAEAVVGRGLRGDR